MVKANHLRWLGLRSLKEVSAGKVLLRDVTELCYTKAQQFQSLFKSSEQRITILNLPSDCGEFLDVCPFDSCLLSLYHLIKLYLLPRRTTEPNL